MPAGEQVRESERLPRDWDGEQGVYCLLYRLKGGGGAGATFLLKVISLEDCLLVNLMVSHFWHFLLLCCVGSTLMTLNANVFFKFFY